MKIRSIISVSLLMAALSAPVFAAPISFGSDVLYGNPGFNRNLEIGEYKFGGKLNPRYGSKFGDTWKFTVATTSYASISIHDFESNFGKSNAIQQTKFRQLRQLRGSINSVKVFDTKNLTLSVFNQRGRLIGRTGEDGSVDNLNLIAGKWYTIAVKVRSMAFSAAPIMAFWI
jgi:hypothetical protein